MNLLLYAMSFVIIVQVSSLPVPNGNEKIYDLQNEDPSNFKCIEF